jgi:hypothetical protein
MDKNKNQQHLAGGIVDLIREIISQEVDKRDNTAVCMIESVKSDCTLNVYILPDKQTTIKNITNQCRFNFESGDTALLYLIKNRPSNSFIIAKYNAGELDVGWQQTNKDLQKIQQRLEDIKEKI